MVVYIGRVTPHHCKHSASSELHRRGVFSVYEVTVTAACHQCAIYSVPSIVCHTGRGQVTLNCGDLAGDVSGAKRDSAKCPIKKATKLHMKHANYTKETPENTSEMWESGWLLLVECIYVNYKLFYIYIRAIYV